MCIRDRYRGNQWVIISGAETPEMFTGGGRGLYGGGQAPSYTDAIDWINIATTGDAQDFGNLTSNRTEQNSGWASRTRGCLAGGYQHPTGRMNIIDYVTFDTTGNAADFGDLASSHQYGAGLADRIRAVVMGGTDAAVMAVSYTHLTLPTICSV